MTHATNRLQPESSDSPLPLWLWIDPTRRCNLRCTLCYTRRSHTAQDMTPATLALLLDNLAGDDRLRVRMIHLNWRGEPSLNPHLIDLVRLVGRRFPDVPLQWHTNGTLITSAFAHRLMTTTQPHRIYVSIDGGNQESHERNRGAGTFSVALAGLSRLLNARPCGSGHSVGVYQIEMNVHADAYDRSLLDLLERVDDWVRVYPVLCDGREGPHEGVHTQPVPQQPCWWAGNSLCIAPDGTVSVCLLSHSETGTIGNLLAEPVWTVVSRARTFRAQLSLHGRSSVSHCAACHKPPGDVAAAEPTRNQHVLVAARYVRERAV
jgi:uncharacterized Fe-S cluster-containing radical SAM superfamily protein